MTTEPPDGARQILLVRHGRVGENLFWTGVPSALRRARPGDAVHVLTNRPDIWEGNPDVEGVHPLPERIEGPAGTRLLEQALRPLRGIPFAAAVCNNEGPEVAAAIGGMGIPLVLRRPEWDLLPGGGARDGEERFPWARVHRSAAAVAHAAPLGVAPPPWPMHFHVPEEARFRARSVLRDLGLPPGAPLVAFNVGTDQTRRLRARRLDRTWPLENLVDAARSLLGRPGLEEARFYLNQNSPRDLLWSWRAARALPPGRVLFHRRSVDLRTVAAILLESRGLVSSDTGPMHLGLALGVPTVGIFGPRVPPEATTPLDGGLRSRMLGTPPGHPDGIRSVTGEAVADAVVELLRA